MLRRKQRGAGASCSEETPGSPFASGGLTPQQSDHIHTFSDTQDGRTLRLLWSLYEGFHDSATQESSAFEKFFEEFLRQYSRWHPETAGLQGSAEGHPRRVIETAVLHLDKYSKKFEGWIRSTDVTFSNSEACTEGPDIVRMVEILSRSQKNRVVLTQAKFLGPLRRIAVCLKEKVEKSDEYKFPLPSRLFSVVQELCVLLCEIFENATIKLSGTPEFDVEILRESGFYRALCGVGKAICTHTLASQISVFPSLARSFLSYFQVIACNVLEQGIVDWPVLVDVRDIFSSVLQKSSTDKDDNGEEIDEFLTELFETKLTALRIMNLIACEVDLYPAVYSSSQFLSALQETLLWSSRNFQSDMKLMFKKVDMVVHESKTKNLENREWKLDIQAFLLNEKLGMLFDHIQSLARDERFLIGESKISDSAGNEMNSLLDMFSSIFRKFEHTTDHVQLRFFILNFFHVCVRGNASLATSLEAEGLLSFLFSSQFNECVSSVSREVLGVAAFFQTSVLEFIAWVASIPDRSNIEEVRKLVGVIGQCKYAPILEKAVECLLRVLQSRGEHTRQNLLRCTASVDILRVLGTAHVMKKDPEVSEDERKSYEYVEIILRTAFSDLMNDQGSRAKLAYDTDTVVQLFSLLEEPGLQSYVLPRVEGLLSTNLKDADVMVSLYRQFLNAFPPLQSDPTRSNWDRLMMMLGIIRDLLKGDSRHRAQKNFLDADAFVKVLNILNIPATTYESTDFPMEKLAVEALKTVRFLLSGSARSKRIFRETWGYGELTRVLVSVQQGGSITGEVLENLLFILVDSDNLDETRTIANEYVAEAIFGVFEISEENLVCRALDVMINLAEASTVNKSKLANAQTIIHMLDVVNIFQRSEVVLNKVMHLLEVVGRYSITVKELNAFFSLMRKISEESRGNVLHRFLECIEYMTRKDGPEAFFDFEGVSSGISLPSLQGWPSKRGYTFTCWIRVESFDDPQSKPKYEPRVYSFLSSDGWGIEAFFDHSYLIIRTFAAEEVVSDFVFSYIFEEKEWYFLTISQSHRKGWNQGEVKLYVNGELQERTQLKFPKMSSHNLDHCRILTNSELQALKFYRECPLCCQMGTVYLFDGIVSAAQVKQVYELGPNVISTFQPAESFVRESGPSRLFDGQVSSMLLLSYNAKSCEGWNVCFDCSGYISGGKRIDARMLPGTQPCVTHNVKDIIGCLGGIQVLFPFLLRVERTSEEYSEEFVVDPRLTGKLLSLFVAMMRSHRDNRDDLMKCHGFDIINFLLQRLSCKHLAKATIMMLKNAVKVVKDDASCLEEAVIKLFFDFRLWVFAPVESQREAMKTCKEYAKSCLKDGENFIRNRVGIQGLLDALRVCYWHTAEKVSFGQSDCWRLSLDGQRPCEKDLVTLRKDLLDIVYVLCEERTPSLEELEAIVNYLMSTTNDSEREDVLTALLRVMFLTSSSGHKVLDDLIDLHCPEILLKFLNSSNNNVRFLALKCFGRILEKCSQGKRSKFALEKVYSLSVIAESLRKNFDAKLYEAVFEIVIGACTPLTVRGLSTKAIHGIAAPAAIVVLLVLLENCPDTLKLKMLDDVLSLVSPSIQGVTTAEENCDKILGTPAWQARILNVVLIEYTSEVFKQQLQNSVVELVSLLLYRAVSSKPGGWIIFEETLSYLAHLQEIHPAVDYAVLARIFLLNVLNSIRTDNDSGKHCTLASIQGSPFLENFVHFIVTAEDFLFHWSAESVKSRHIEETSDEIADAYEESDVEKSAVLRVDKSGKWQDASVAEGILFRLEEWQLLSVADFDAFEPLRSFSDSKHIRPGGCLRIALRLIRNNLIECPDTVSKNVDRIQKIIERDEEAEQERQRFSELWTVAGDFDDGADFQGRLLHIVSLLLDTLWLYQERNLEDFLSGIGQVLYTIVKRRKVLLRPYLKDDSGNSIYDEYPKLFSVKTPVVEFLDTAGSDRWKHSLQRLFSSLPASSVTMDLENLIHSVISRREFTRLRVIHSRKSLDIELRTSATHYSSDYVRKFDEKKETEAKRLLQVRSDWDERDRSSMRYWQRIKRAVTTERGAWGLESGVQNVFYKLDRSEDSMHARRKLRRDYDGTRHEDAMAEDSKEDDDVQKESEMPPTSLTASLRTGLELAEEPDTVDFDPDVISLDPQASYRNILDSAEMESEQGYTFECDFVRPLEVVEGFLTIERAGLHFRPVLDLEKKTEGSPRSHFYEKEYIVCIRLRRFRLQRTALEIYMTDGTSTFLNIRGNKRNKALRRILAIRPPNLKPLYASVQEELRKTGLTEMWRRRQISNFEYLMHLNDLAGRSYNDICQYYVFPWIISDYESETLDLTDESIYRDLTKPIGALNPKRLDQFIERFEVMKGDPLIPPFHYGSHYSSPGIVFYYMIRLEPFTSYHITLQGGKFDHADRLFDSIGWSWKSVLDSTADVKELIPEFFYFPEFLKNMNDVPLGKKQNGVRLGDVKLPPWAKSPEEFIRINREALESEYVSKHLSDWIDLILGYKQRGPAAVEANNIFYHLTYEGSVALDEIDDPLIRSSMESQIENFGQTPTQLFKRPHPQRSELDPSASRPLITASDLFVIHSHAVRGTGSSAIVFISVKGDRVFLATRTGLGVAGRFIIVPGLEQAITLVPDSASGRKRIGVPTPNFFSTSPRCYAVGNYEGREVVFSCGHWDMSFRCSAVSTMQTIQSVWQHRDLVTCLSLSKDGTVLVTGSLDTTVIVWSIKGTGRNIISPKPRHILYGHDDEVVEVVVSTDLDVVVSASWDGTCIVHSLVRGRYLSTLNHPSKNPIDLLSLFSENGDILAFSKVDRKLLLFSINGQLKRSAHCGEALSSMCVSSDGKFVVTAGSVYGICIRRIYDLSMVHRFDMKLSGVVSLYVGEDNRCILAGRENGEIVSYFASTAQSRK